MKFKKIRTKMLVTFLSPIILAMGALAIISLLACSKIVNNQIGETMDARLEAESEAIEKYLQIVESTAMTISRTVSSSYQYTELSQYEEMFAAIIPDNDMVLGSGIWFEPYVYDENEKYVGPYIYKDGNAIVTTYDYSNADYDYFVQEYYTNAKSATGPMITDPYYDATTDTIMSSCSMPMYDNGKFIGCVTVDIELTSIEGVVSNITVGENGTAFLTSGSGTYLAGVESSKVQNEESILYDENDSLAEAGSEMISLGAGKTTYTALDNTKYNLYFATIPTTGWHIAIQMPLSEVLQPIFQLFYKLLGIALAGLVVCCLIVLFQVSGIAKSIRNVQVFAKDLAEGNFTIRNLEVRTRDELGAMGKFLNDMYESTRSIIQNVQGHSNEIADSSSNLKESATKLKESFNEIETYMSKINEAMMTASASTEEVNASVDTLAHEAKDSLAVSQEIKQRARAVEESSKTSHKTATELTVQFEQRLGSSIENAKVVDQIGQMVRGIAGIAEHINMLSLNASIEAARAGAQGKGFAVVAGEIGKLAGDTEDLVKNIESVIGAVQDAFKQLSSDSQDLLNFLQERVTPDYNQFVETAGQYGKDAEYFASNAEQISTIMQEVKQAVENIAEAAQNTAATGSMIMSSVEDVSGMVGDVAIMSHKQQEIADDLDVVVKRFQL